MMVRQMALNCVPPVTVSGAATPPDPIKDSTPYAHHGTFAGAGIDMKQLGSGVWVLDLPQPVVNDWVSFGGAGEPWYPKAFECWVNLPAEVSHGTTYHVLLLKHASYKTGLILDYVSSPNTITVWFEDSSSNDSTSVYTATGYGSFLHVLGFFNSVKKAELVVNGVSQSVGSAINDNKGNSTDLTGADIILGGGLASRYSTIQAAWPRIYIGNENTGTDAYWRELARGHYESEKRMFGL